MNEQNKDRHSKKGRLKAVLVPLYLALYDRVAPDLIGSLAPMAGRMAEILRGMADVTVFPVVSTQEDVLRLTEACADADCVITLHLAYSPSLLTAHAIAGLSKPILILDTTVDRGFDAMSGEYLLRNHGIHGVMDFAAVLRSLGAAYTICAGHYRDASFIERLERSLKTIHAALRFKNQTIGITGKPFAMMGDFAVDFDFLFQKFSQKVAEITEEDILTAMDEADGREVLALYEKEVRDFGFDGDGESLKTNIRQYLAFGDIFEKKGISAYTMNFDDFYKTPVPFYAINNMMKSGLGYAGEGDVLTASLGPALNALAEKAAFSEFFCPDWDRDLLLMSHMGEADPRFAREGSRIVLKEKIALGKSVPSYYYEFEAQPMELTFATWTKNPGGALRLLAGQMDCVPHPVFKELGAPHFVVQSGRRLDEFLNEYSMNGGGHHLYVAQGARKREMELFASLIGVDFCFME